MTPPLVLPEGWASMRNAAGQYTLYFDRTWVADGFMDERAAATFAWSKFAGRIAHAPQIAPAPERKPRSVVITTLTVVLTLIALLILGVVLLRLIPV